MSTKSIRIEPEAYDRLKHARKPGETLSQTILRLVPATAGRRRIDLDKLCRELDAHPPSPGFLAAMDELLRNRR